MVYKHLFTGILITGCSFVLSAQKQTERIWEHHPLPNNATANIKGIAFDLNGAMLIAINGVGVGGYRYIEADDWTAFISTEHHHDMDGINEIGCDVSSCVAVDYLNNVWFGSNSHGISVLTDTTWRHITEKKGLINNSIRQILIIRDTTWVATGGGVVKIVGDSIINYPITGYSRDTNITCLTFDLSGNLWVGTTNGIFKFDGTTWSSRHRPVNSGGLDANYTDAITVDSKGNIWAAMYKQGIYKFDGKDWKLQFSKESTDFTCLIFDKKGNLWAGTTTKGVWEYNGTYWMNYISDMIFNNSVYSIAVKDDVVWIGCRGGLTKVYEKTISYLIDSKENTPVSIYPNPVRNQFTASNVENAMLFLYTISGQKIGTYYSLGKDLTIDASPFEQGIYILKIENNDKTTSTFKISVIR